MLQLKRSQQISPVLCCILIILTQVYTCLANSSNVTLTYKGELKSTTNQIVTSSYTMTFKIYSTSDSQVELWNEVHQDVSVNQGVFSVELGSITPLGADLAQYQQLFVGLQIEDGIEFSPRMKLGTVLRSKFADVALHAKNVTGESINPASISVNGVEIINNQGQWVGQPEGVGGNCELSDNGNGRGVINCGGAELQVLVPGCGDGILNPGEQCDDGNEDNTDDCTMLCQPPTCGDGFINNDEECDDSGESATCDVDCSVATCGDGLLNLTSGEIIDDLDHAISGSHSSLMVTNTTCTSKINCQDIPGPVSVVNHYDYDDSLRSINGITIRDPLPGDDIPQWIGFYNDFSPIAMAKRINEISGLTGVQAILKSPTISNVSLLPGEYCDGFIGFDELIDCFVIGEDGDQTPFVEAINASASGVLANITSSGVELTTAQAGHTIFIHLSAFGDIFYASPYILLESNSNFTLTGSGSMIDRILVYNHINRSPNLRSEEIVTMCSAYANPQLHGECEVDIGGYTLYSTYLSDEGSTIYNSTGVDCTFE